MAAPSGFGGPARADAQVDDFENFELRGEFRVNTGFDDDSSGVVFGYRNPLDVGDPIRDTWAIEWRKAPQGAGPEGFRLNRWQPTPDGLSDERVVVAQVSGPGGH